MEMKKGRKKEDGVKGGKDARQVRRKQGRRKRKVPRKLGEKEKQKQIKLGQQKMQLNETNA